jgi:L-seryl-tRNA(Ser) seleniumtransferase
MDERKQAQLKKLPGVDRILEYGTKDRLFDDIPKSVLIPAIRAAIEDMRTLIRESKAPVDDGCFTRDTLVAQIKERAGRITALKLKRTVNATGVVVHTNLGRSLLSPAVMENLTAISSRYSNLEFDLDAGRRGSRYSAVEGILCELSGAQAAMVVNNNAAATLLCLDTLATGREVIVSRGELVEIGGAYRIPDVMAKSGAILKEVGTTNRTHPRDYENAIGEQTGLLLKVHTSNLQHRGIHRRRLPVRAGVDWPPPPSSRYGRPGQRHPGRFFQIRADQGTHCPGIPGRRRRCGHLQR